MLPSKNTTEPSGSIEQYRVAPSDTGEIPLLAAYLCDEILYLRCWLKAIEKAHGSDVLMVGGDRIRAELTVEVDTYEAMLRRFTLDIVSGWYRRRAEKGVGS